MFAGLMKRIRTVAVVNSVIRHLLRFIAYTLPDTIGSKLVPRWRVYGCFVAEASGLRFTFSSKGDDGIADELFYRPHAYSEAAELRLFGALSAHSSCILDIGAHTGLYSIVAAVSSGRSKIIAFEPYSANADRLRCNLALNRLGDRVEVVEIALGEKAGEAVMAVPLHDQLCDAASIDTAHTERYYRRWIQYRQITVPQQSLDEFVSDRKLQDVDLVKIDVENLELQVLKGAASTLERWKPHIQCEIFVDETKVAFYENFLRPLGYVPYLILNSGLVRAHTLYKNPDGRNYFFSTSQTASEYCPFSEMNKLVAELRARQGAPTSVAHREISREVVL